jgi:hypothetical protein
VLGVVIVLLPWYILPVCEVYDSYLITSTGAEIPMKCGWTARAEFGTGVGIASIGAVLLAFGKRKETQRALGVVGGTLGVFTILFPTYLIGVCASATHPCYMGTRPGLVLLGVLVIIISLTMVFMAREE